MKKNVGLIVVTVIALVMAAISIFIAIFFFNTNNRLRSQMNSFAESQTRSDFLASSLESEVALLHKDIEEKEAALQNSPL